MIVRESISFERGKDPKKTLGIGQRYFIEKWLDEMEIKNYHINDDFTIDIIKKPGFDGRVDISNRDLIELPEYIQFNIVPGYFAISNNLLTTLRGCPKYVSNNFWCSRNELTSLEFCPEIVEGSFICHHNAKFFNKKYVSSLCKTPFSRIQS